MIGGSRARRAADLGYTRLACPDLVRSGRHAGDHHPVHGALRTARRHGEAYAWPADVPQPCWILVRLRRRPQPFWTSNQGTSTATLFVLTDRTNVTKVTAIGGVSLW